MTIDINELREAIQTFGSQAINEGDMNELLDRLEAAEKGHDELHARIEAMEKQEPVASVWRCDNGHIHGSCERTLPMGAKLYALPGTKGE